MEMPNKQTEQLQMPGRRFGHGAATINSGKRAIVFGGLIYMQGCWAPSNDVFAFDCETEQWTKLSPENMEEAPCPRNGFDMTAVGDSMVAISGKSCPCGEEKDDELYILDFSNETVNGRWRKVKTEGERPIARFGQTLTYIEPNLVMIGGKVNDVAVDDVWTIDITASPTQWKRLEIKGDKPQERYNHAACALKNKVGEDVVLVFGGCRHKESTECSLEEGCGRYGKMYNDLWALDHKNGKWTCLYSENNKDSKVPKRRCHHVMLSYQNKLLVIGGKSYDITEGTLPMEVYDLDKHEWESFADIKRFVHVSWLYGNKLFHHGGFTKEEGDDTRDSKVEAVNIEQYMQQENIHE